MPLAVPLRAIYPGHTILVDYWDAVPGLRALLPRHVREPAAFDELAGVLRRGTYDRSALAAALEQQNRLLGADETALASVRRLADPHSLVVIGGQQAGLFGGPLYTLHKAVCIRALASRLESEVGGPVVPVFWIASEDHDLAEVARTWTLTDGAPRQIALPAHLAAAAANRLPVAQVKLGDEVAGALGEAARSLRDGAGPEVLGPLTAAWDAAASFPVAFGRWMHWLLGGLGIVLVDPFDEGLKRLAVPLLRREIEERGPVGRAVREQTDRLAAAGYAAQLELHDGMLTLFRHQPGRTPITVDDRGFGTPGSSVRFAASDLVRQLEQEPLAFSPNAALRPLVQDTLFPTLAFVTGPAETAYVTQLALAYERFGVPMPVIVPRTSVTLIEPAVARLMDRRGLSLADVIAAGSRLATLLAGRALPTGLQEALDGARARLEQSWRDLVPAIRQLDPSLERTAAAAAARGAALFDTVQRKAARALKRRDAELRSQADRIIASLVPQGRLQERTYCSLPFLARWGRSLAALILERMDPARDAHQGVVLP